MYVPIAVNLGKVPQLPNGKHVLAGGVEIYIKDGQKHRTNGPAEINNRTGYQAWFKNGKKHRKDEPAVTYPDGTKEYWLEGKFLQREILDERGNIQGKQQ